MDYQKYFDELEINFGPKDARTIVDILEKQAANPVVKQYDGIEELVFEVMMYFLKEQDFVGLESFGKLIAKHYPDVYEQEKGQLLSILMEWYLRQGKIENAAKAWREWYQSDYDYDLILEGLNVLILYHQTGLIEEYIDREYRKVDTSTRLIPGSASILLTYKLYLGTGKFIGEKATIDDIDREIQAFGGKVNDSFKVLLKTGNTPVPVQLFSTNREAFLESTAFRAQRFLQLQHGIPFISSTSLLEVYWGCIAKSKSNNYSNYFKTAEEKLTRYLILSANEHSLSNQYALALTHLLPLFFDALIDQGIFKQPDAAKESAKATSVFKQLARKFPDDLERAGHLRLYGKNGGK